MPQTIRSINIDLQRHLRGGHEALSAKLEQLTNAAYVSQMARGEREVTDADARRIEQLLTVPEGWLDRDHRSLFKMSSTEFELLLKIRELPVPKQNALLALLP